MTQKTRRFVIFILQPHGHDRPSGPAMAAEIAVSNPGFEQLEPSGTVIGWRLVDRSLQRGRLVRRRKRSRSTAASAASDSTVKGHGTVTAESDPVALEVGKLYRLSGWIRTEGVVSDPMAKYPTAVPACLTMEALPFTIHSPSVGGDSDWFRVDLPFIATSASDRVRLHLGYNGTPAAPRGLTMCGSREVEDINEYIPLETVRWSGPGFRYDDQGWIFVHIEGEPYERGYQYGSLMPDEIVEYIRKLGVVQYGDDPEAGWDTIRFEADALFLRKYDDEYLTEMKGIADGAADAGGEAWGRPIDLRDIVAINSVVDIGQLYDALEVTPNSLTGQAFAAPDEELDIDVDQHKCSAFAATGPATRDGDIVFGQIFMWSGYTGMHWNVITDVEPSDGYRLVYHTFPGGIHSGADFYLNEAGIAFGETTVAQTPYEANSTPQSNRARKAAQYAASIDDVERILWEKNNGMYTNDWPIADFETGEVAILLLGTHTKKMWRTSEDMNPFGTPGFLWANNNNRDPEVRKEYVAQPDDRPFDLMFSPWNRDVAFNEFYRENKGKIDANAGVASVGLVARQPRPRLRRQDHQHRDGQRDGLPRSPRQGDPAREVSHQGLALPSGGAAGRRSPPQPRLLGGEPGLCRRSAPGRTGQPESRRDEDDVPDLEFGATAAAFEIRQEGPVAGHRRTGVTGRELVRQRYRRLLADARGARRRRSGARVGGTGAAELAAPRGALPLHRLPRAGSAGARCPPRLRSLRPLSVAADQGHLRPPPVAVSCSATRSSSMLCRRPMTDTVAAR